MELVDRYVHEVGRHLPRRGRADIQTEIRSLIEDTLEGYAQKQGRDVDEEMVIAVLQEFGDPQTVAASYRGSKQYLVGPELFPIFKIVLTVVVSVISAIYLIGILITLSRAEDFLNTLWSIVSGTLPEYISSIVGIFGIIVIVFAILERVLTPQQLAEEDEAWDPTKLEKVEDPDRINPIGEMISIILLTILLVIFNFFPQWVGIYFFTGQERGFVSVLVEGYQALLPWITLWWLASLAIKIINLRRGRWTTLTRIGEIGVNLIGIYVIFQIFSGAPFFGVNPAWSYGPVDWAITLLAGLGGVAGLVTRIVLGILLIVSVFEIIAQVYKLLTNRSSPIIQLD